MAHRRGEFSLDRARRAFEEIEFHPRILRDVAHTATATATTIFGGPSALPFGIAPTGFARLMRTEGEIAGAAGAAASRSRSPRWARPRSRA